MFIEEIAGTDTIEVIKQRAAGHTFQEIGDLCGVTRECVRQTVGRFFSKIDPLMCKLADILKKQESFISCETLHGIFEEDDYNEVLAAWFKYSARFSYDNEAESFQVKTI